MKSKHLTASIAAAALVALASYFVVARKRTAPESAREPAPVAKAAPSVPGRSDIDIAVDHTLDDSKQLRAIHALGNDLCEKACDQIMTAVADKRHHPTVRNDLLLVIERQKKKRQGVGRELAAMWHDEKEDRTFRDYCLQHLEAVYGFDPNETGMIQDVLLRAAAGKGSYSDTALLSLQRLSERDPALLARVKEISQDVIKSSDGRTNRAVTALETARRTGDASALVKARELAGDPRAGVRTRMSAIGLIGELGDERDETLLKQLLGHQDDRLRRVARYNLKRIQKRVRS